MRHLAPLVLLASSLGCKGEDGDTGAASWLVPQRDLGARHATGGDPADLSDADQAWFVAEQLVPLLEWQQPGAQIPLELWREVQRPTVADEGQCPTVEVSGDTTTWKTYGCRSSQGYEWTGEVSKTTWSEDDWTWNEYAFDLTVTGDTDDVAFDRIALSGGLVFVDGDDAALVEAVQVNVSASAEGLLSRADVDDPREALWRDWRVTGRYEERPGGVHQFDGDAVLGSVGALGFSTGGLAEVAGCDASPEGSLRLAGAQAAELTFHGESDCRACADYALDGAESGEACGTGR